LTDGEWPNLFVVGAPRAGTTSLWHYLDGHPEIWMAPVKEPQFFSGLWYDEDSYLRLFAPGAGFELRGEASPSYLGDAGVADAIRRVSPEARIVIMLREPLERTYSTYWHDVRHGVEDRPFLTAVRAELATPRPDGRPSRYVGRSFYADGVSEYLHAFPGRAHVILFEEFARNTRREVRKVFEFLGVDASVASQLESDVHNPFALPRSRVAAFAYHSRRIRAAKRAFLPRALYPLVERLVLRRSRKPSMEPEAEALLTAHFAPDVERLRVVLGRDLPWPRFGGAEQAQELELR
jgi:hypothetical protein